MLLCENGTFVARPRKDNHFRCVPLKVRAKWACSWLRNAASSWHHALHSNIRAAITFWRSEITFNHIIARAIAKRSVQSHRDFTRRRNTTSFVNCTSIHIIIFCITFPAHTEFALFFSILQEKDRNIHQNNGKNIFSGRVYVYLKVFFLIFFFVYFV